MMVDPIRTDQKKGDGVSHVRGPALNECFSEILSASRPLHDRNGNF